MTEEWQDHCAVCASRDHGGDLQVYEVAGAAAVPIGELEAVRLCTPCFAFALETVVSGVERPTHQQHDVHLPDRVAPECPPLGCEVCHETMSRRPGFGIVLASSQPQTSAAPLARLQQRLEHRFCGSCLDWLRDVVDQESASRWANRRSSEDPRGSVPADVRYTVVSLGLGPSDEAALREAVPNLGHVYARHEGDSPNSELVRFVAATADGNATAVTEALPSTERVRVVVVSDAANLADATEALRLGAADLLAAPLSRQQITGQFDRLADPFAVSGRDDSTGLPRYWLRPRFGLPCFELLVRPTGESSLLETFLVLRRFLRGYDRIGVADNTLPTMVYCSEPHIEGIIQRMRRLLGPECRIELSGHAPADGPARTTLDDVTPRPALARAFFGRRQGRRAS